GLPGPNKNAPRSNRPRIAGCTLEPKASAWRSIAVCGRIQIRSSPASFAENREKNADLQNDHYALVAAGHFLLLFVAALLFVGFFVGRLFGDFNSTSTASMSLSARFSGL